MALFPALRASLAKRLCPYMPPHPMRSLAGAALAALLMWTASFVLYGVGVGIQGLWTGASSVATSVTEVLQTVPRATESTQLAMTDPNAPPAPAPELPPAPLPEPEPVLTGRQPLPPKSAEDMGVRNPPPVLPFPVIEGTPTVREQLQSFDLPYAEGPTATPADAARQLDYALSQTFLRLGMDFSRLELLQSQPRTTTPTPNATTSALDATSPASAKPYQFQRMRVHLVGSAEDFITNLEASLEAWAEGAVLEQTRRNGRTLLRLLAGGVPTHEIFLQPSGTVFNQPPRLGEPRLTIVIDDMGADLAALRELLSLDLPITISILPYTAHAAETARIATAAGQEVLLHQPMEPMQAPYISPGPNALLLSMTPEAQRDTLRRNMARFPQAVGLNNHMGSRATRDRDLSRLVAEEAAAAGFFVLDSVTIPDSVLYEEARAARLTAYRRNIFLDDSNPGRRAILNFLKNAEQTALRTGQAIVIGHPRPDTIAALKEWVHKRNPDIAVVPLRYQ